MQAIADSRRLKPAQTGTVYKKRVNHDKHAMEGFSDEEDEHAAGWQSPDPLGNIDETVEEVENSRLYHIKIMWCPWINWEVLAKKIYEPEKQCLVMAEHLNKSTGHVHMQGWTTRSDRSLAKIRQDVHSKHSLFIEFKRKKAVAIERGLKFEKNRIVISSVKAGDATARGFQYQCKEVNVPLYSQGFTPEELAELHANHNAFIQTKKRKVHEILETAFAEQKLTFPPDVAALPERMSKLVKDARFIVAEHRRDEGQRISSRYFKEDILNALHENRRATKKHRYELAQMF